MYCSQCGNNVENASFCNQCGTPTSNNAPPPPPAEPTTPPPVETSPEESLPQPDSPPEAAPPEPPYQPEPQSAPPPPQPEPAAQVPAPPPPPPAYQPPPPQYHQPPPQYAYNQPVKQGFLGEVYSKSFGFLFKKPVLLWGLSVLFTLLTFLAIIFGIFPIIWLPVIFVLELGMANIFLKGYRGHAISSTLLFEGFSKRFARNAGGMGWRALWLLIWSLIPVAGIVMAIIKFYSYRFVPYIMLAEPDIQATEALKKSMALTNGYKGKMFLADFLIGLCVIVLTIIFTLVMQVPFIGIVFFAIFHILLVALLPLIMGTLEAVYYDKVSSENTVS